MEAWFVEFQSNTKTLLGLCVYFALGFGGDWSEEVKNSVVINKTAAPLKWKFCCSGLIGLRTFSNWEETNINEVKLSGSISLGSSHQNCISSWKANHSMLESPRWYWFGRHKGVMKNKWGMKLCVRAVMFKERKRETIGCSWDPSRVERPFNRLNTKKNKSSREDLV